MKRGAVALVALLLSAWVTAHVSAEDKGKSEQPDTWMPNQKAQDLKAITYEGNSVSISGDNVGPGMEVIKIDQVNIIAPKGTRVRKEGSQVVFEDLGEYLGRKFDEIEQRFSQIEASQEELKKQMEEIRQGINELRKESILLR